MCVCVRAPTKPKGLKDLGEKKERKKHKAGGKYMGLFGRCSSYLVWAGGLVDPACVFIMLLGLGLVSHAIGFVHWSHVVHQGNGLHSLMNSAADGLADLGGSGSS